LLKTGGFICHILMQHRLWISAEGIAASLAVTDMRFEQFFFATFAPLR
jgi:hypothetical protein